MTHPAATDEVIAALDAMEAAMAEFEAELNGFEQRTGRVAKGALVEEALTAVEAASSDRDAALEEMEEVAIRSFLGRGAGRSRGAYTRVGDLSREVSAALVRSGPSKSRFWIT